MAMQPSSDYEYILIGRMEAPTGQGEGLGLNHKEHGGRKGGTGGVEATLHLYSSRNDPGTTNDPI